MADYGYHKGEPLFGGRTPAPERLSEDDMAIEVENSIIVGDQWPPNPRIGDYPPFVPNGPYIPPLVPITIPSTGTADSIFGTSRENKMDIFIIWAIVPDQPEAPWVVAAWDSESVAGNKDGWLEEVAKAENEFGGRFVRITKTSVNYDKVVGAFEPTEV